MQVKYRNTRPAAAVTTDGTPTPIPILSFVPKSSLLPCDELDGPDELVEASEAGADGREADGGFEITYRRRSRQLKDITFHS